MFMQQERNPNLEPFSIQGKDLADPNAFSNGMSPEKQKMLAKLLAQGMSGTQDKPTDYVNGFAVQNSPYQGLGSMFGGLMNAYMMGAGK